LLSTWKYQMNQAFNQLKPKSKNVIFTSYSELQFLNNMHISGSNAWQTFSKNKLKLLVNS
jgi:hypothetical protein